MKNVFCGFNAKLALALLAVGTLSSCYEKEELDKTPQKDPDPAKYFIQGNVTNAEDGTALPGAAVTVDGAAQSLNADGYFITADLKKAGEYKVTSKLADFNDAVKTVTLPETAAGGVCIASADFAMVPVYVEPEPEDRPGLPT